MYLCCIKSKIKHKLVLLSFLIQEVGTYGYHRHQKSSPNRHFLTEKSLLYMCCVVATLFVHVNLNLNKVPVLFVLKCTNLCSHSSSCMNLRQTTVQYMAVSSSLSINKLSHNLSVQTICWSSNEGRANNSLGIPPTLPPLNKAM